MIRLKWCICHPACSDKMDFIHVKAQKWPLWCGHFCKICTGNYGENIFKQSDFSEENNKKL